MVMAVVSTLALALAFGPQLQVNLQAVLDQPVVESVSEDDARPVETTGDPNQDPVADSPIDTIEETVIAPIEIAVPQLEPSEAATNETELPEASADDAGQTAAQNGEVPAAEWPSILTQASAALGAANTARGNFIQTNIDGSTITGTFALNRPGRMRFDYDDPSPVLIVSDGTTVAMADSELETVDRLPIGSTPLGLILSTQLNVEDDVEVLSIMQNDERIGIRVSDASGELEGTLTMVFDKTSYDLIGWLAIDGNFQTTVVDLQDVETNVRIDPRLFRLNEDDEDEDER